MRVGDSPSRRGIFSRIPASWWALIFCAGGLLVGSPSSGGTGSQESASLVELTSERESTRSKEDARRLRQIMLFYQEYRASFPDVSELSPAELQLRLERGEIVLIDVRHESERRVSSIPGAITREEYEKNPALYADKPVATYCTAGYRSGVYARNLDNAGVEAFNLVGGILAWVHEGLPVQHAGASAWRVHVYGRQWSLLPEGYEAVW